MSGVGEIGWIWGLDKIVLASGKSKFFLVYGSCRAKSGLHFRLPPFRTERGRMGHPAFVRNLDFTCRCDGGGVLRIFGRSIMVVYKELCNEYPGGFAINEGKRAQPSERESHLRRS